MIFWGVFANVSTISKLNCTEMDGNQKYHVFKNVLPGRNDSLLLLETM